MKESHVAPKLNHREVCTVLAALRVFQAHELTDHFPGDRGTCIRDLDHFDDCTPLTGEEIDALCERIQIPPES